MERDYYSVLGVSRYASRDAVRRAFRSHILMVHPDRNPGDEIASQRARELIEAYKALSDPWTRQNHDLALVRVQPTAICRQRECTVSFWTPRAVMVGLFVVIAISIIVASANYMMNRTPVFRPYVGVIDLSENHPVNPAVVAAPDVSDTQEWYAAREYEACLASDGATRNLVETYSEAALAAVRRGDPDCARFYIECVQAVRNSGTVVML